MAQLVNLTQDTGGTGALVPTLPIPFSSGPPAVDLSQYLLMVFQSSDWDVGRIDNTYALGITELDVAGNWITSPIYVISGTYHVIIRNNYGTTKVIKAYLGV